MTVTMLDDTPRKERHMSPTRTYLVVVLLFSLLAPAGAQPRIPLPEARVPGLPLIETPQ